MNKQICALAACVLLGSAVLYAAPLLRPVGHVVYLSGDPSAVRAARPLWLGIGLGLRVQPFDFFQTGADELIEIQTEDHIGVRAMLRIQPHSAVYLEVPGNTEPPSHALRLLSGAVSVRMRDADPRARLEVLTAGPEVSAAGADYDVTLALDGGVLVTVSYGTARVADPRGRVLFADAERAVEYRPDGTFRTVAMSIGRADRFRSVWRDQIESDFAFDAIDTYRRYADGYLDQLPRFEAAYRQLMDQRHILDRWMENDRQGRDPRRQSEVTEAEVRELGPTLDQAYEALLPFEANWYRLQRLARYADAGVGPLDRAVGERLSVAEFFERLGREGRIVEDQMHTVRYAIRLYRQQSAALLRTE